MDVIVLALAKKYTDKWLLLALTRLSNRFKN